ncbi:uncharacterized protein ALTATR162_LOCUS7212 [Alternaria atra]|uniref:Uncharacterized protein n=1 Tax=Alternaria atra TaxID=119953 RepID=A0A8J2I5A1_9PLEO|nr:uncharacterized protein ALTATR162_LOCUS7212 [Alternaria atra]CAG5170653.1 unnamed protein product [Alternaria atra]
MTRMSELSDCVRDEWKGDVPNPELGDCIIPPLRPVYSSSTTSLLIYIDLCTCPTDIRSMVPRVVSGAICRAAQQRIARS